MKTIHRRPAALRVPGFNRNAVLQLIVASGIGFVVFHLTDVIMRLADSAPGLFENRFASNLGLVPMGDFGLKFWVVLTYGWTHSGFWELFSNMIWLYAFGSIVQMLVGYRQVIPLFIYCLIAGAIFYYLGQLVPGTVVRHPWVFGAQAAVTGMAVAALALAPSYRMHFTPTFSIPLVVVAIIFFALMVLNSNLEVPRLFLIAGGAGMGYGYVRLIQNGYRPGDWMYEMFEKAEQMVGPDERRYKHKTSQKRSRVLNNMYEPKHGITQQRIDDILDKINQRGYNALTKEEKDILLNASKEEL